MTASGNLETSSLDNSTQEYGNLSRSVQEWVEAYFMAVKNLPPDKHFQQIIRLLEKPILQATLKITQANLSKTAKLLGISRNTLKAKLIESGLMTLNNPNPKSTTGKSAPTKGFAQKRKKRLLH